MVKGMGNSLQTFGSPSLVRHTIRQRKPSDGWTGGRRSGVCCAQCRCAPTPTAPSLQGNQTLVPHRAPAVPEQQPVARCLSG